jgi:plastocyanin
MTKRKYLVAAVGLVALLGVACGGDDDGGTASGDDGGGSVTLTASDLAWDTSTVTVPAGGSIEVVNEDDTEHNFTVEEADIDEDVDEGSSTTVDLGDVEPGSYDFFCEYHPDTMTGTLEVE